MFDCSELESIKKFLQIKFKELSAEDLDVLVWRYEDYEYNDDLSYVYDEIGDKLDCLWEGHGCTKICFRFVEFSDYIIKIPFLGVRVVDDGDLVDERYYNEEDYCAIEETVYLVAKEHNVSELFAETSFLGEIRGVPVYIAEYCPEKYHRYSIEISEDSKKRSMEISQDKEFRYCGEILSYLSILLEQYGEEFSKRVLKMVEECEIEDLHTDNVAFDKNGKFKLIDYSSFNDQEEQKWQLNLTNMSLI